jgi:hypothetical protein
MCNSILQILNIHFLDINICKKIQSYLCDYKCVLYYFLNSVSYYKIHMYHKYYNNCKFTTLQHIKDTISKLDIVYYYSYLNLESRNLRSKLKFYPFSYKYNTAVLFGKLYDSYYILISYKNKELYLYLFQTLNSNFFQICNIQYEHGLLYQCIKTYKLQTYIE